MLLCYFRYGDIKNDLYMATNATMTAMLLAKLNEDGI